LPHLEVAMSRSTRSIKPRTAFTVVLIPAYQPGDSLVAVVRALSESPVPAIVVVDDGSGPQFTSTFIQVASLPRVTLLRHANNLGKGAGLKTGMKHIRSTYPRAAGVVTADADGQHQPEDILKVCERLRQSPHSLVMGVRGFEGQVPFRSRVGNQITRRVMLLLLGRDLSDTQSGLRAIPYGLVDHLLTVSALGYEFEAEMLVAAKHLDVRIVEQPIRTIYEAHNPSSHFRPLWDSMRIYFVLLRFGLVSMLSSAIDNLSFYLALHWGGATLIGAQLGARAVSVLFNYGAVRKAAFHSGQAHRVVLPRYFALVGLNLFLSFAGIKLLNTVFGLGLAQAKILSETVLFFLSFAVQRDFVFTLRGRSPQPARAPGKIRWVRPLFKETQGW
jgi:glycosyltransferase involved in cell wall biosynthesis